MTSLTAQAGIAGGGGGGGGGGAGSSPLQPPATKGNKEIFRDLPSKSTRLNLLNNFLFPYNKS